MSNTTLSRKPGNDMKKNQGFQPATRKSDQAGDGADFAFNGQMGDGVNRRTGDTNGRWSGNQVGLAAKENYGSGPRRGNQSDSGNERGIGKSVTRDKEKMTIATASQGMNVGKETTATRFQNPDAINVGMK